LASMRACIRVDLAAQSSMYIASYMMKIAAKPRQARPERSQGSVRNCGGR